MKYKKNEERRERGFAKKPWEGDSGFGERAGKSLDISWAALFSKVFNCRLVSISVGCAYFGTNTV